MSAPQPDVPAADAATEGPQITETACVRCGTALAGLDGRYACGVCGWTNNWSEGYRDLPTAEDDPDHPERAAGKAKARREH
jgi:ribosomal protein S27AE